MTPIWAWLSGHHPWLNFVAAICWPILYILERRRAEMWKRFAKDYQELTDRAIKMLQEWEDES